MVTPPSCPGLHVEILVNGQPLQEYDDIDESSVPLNTITKYIEARSDVNFAVRARFDEGFLFPAGDIKFETTLDRRYEARCVIKAAKLFQAKGKISEGPTSRIGETTNALYKYRFKALDLVEDTGPQVGEGLMRDIQAMGIITAKLQYIREIRPDEAKIGFRDSKSFGEIPEKAFKGQPKSHYGGIDLAIPMKIHWLNYDYIGNGPFVTVNFKYRSLDVLRALHIIPREPTPLPIEDRPIEDLNHDETREVLRLYKNREAEALKIKKEANNKRARSGSAETAGEDDVVIVDGPSHKRRRGGDSEVIVLD
ncbi:hypothetical protein JI435_054430 [Parastagonospora nodorum SN15]|uniref:DUF7918 domain-containing protein n=1 Tax=Phaeosphaeria nodorum (strain SN15 / ATCC MYA-4574 / FGSC 10173) TaxID=321614 RepID=A0A7U2FC47_PHANO|nr:hypothetical protein JI435_054430 [Parastagonospora nodorum SN15]